MGDDAMQILCAAYHWQLLFTQVDARVQHRHPVPLPRLCNISLQLF